MWRSIPRTGSGAGICSAPISGWHRRSRLEPKGDVLLISPGATVTLETNLLRLRARVVEINYGDGPLPPNSYFENVTIEFAVWLKQGVGAPAAAGGNAALPPMPSAPPAYEPAPAYNAPPVAPPPAMPQARPVYEDYDEPATQAFPPQQPPPPPPMPSRRPPDDDDPFDGTADFNPVNRS